MEVEVSEVLELETGRREQLFGGLDVPVHRAADVEEEQNLDGVAALGAQLDIKIALLRRFPDRIVEIQLLGGARARKTAQPPQRDAHVADPELDINKAFAPISLLATQPYVLLVPHSLPVNSVKELIAHAKAKPGALNYGSSGHGSSAHLGMELFKQMAGVDMVHIAYKGIGPAIVDLMGGRVQLLFGSAVSAGNAAKTGRVKALAVASARRAKSLPDLPTIAESGVPNFDLTGWYGVVAPAGTPPAVIAKLNQEIAQLLASPEIQTRLSNDGSEATPTTPAQFKQIIANDIQRWQKLMQQTNLGL